MAIIKEIRGFVPKIGENCFVAETAAIIGDVTIRQMVETTKSMVRLKKACTGDNPRLRIKRSGVSNKSISDAPRIKISYNFGVI